VSWRVLLLPYLEQENLYRIYRWEEPWDGPNNIKLLNHMPRVYRLPGDERSTPQGYTHLRVFVSAANVRPRAAFEHDFGVPLDTFHDGRSNTILVVEAAEAVPWTRPEELVYDPDKPLPPLGGHFGDDILAVFGDASVRAIPKRIGEHNLRALITRDGGEVVDWPGVR
jgi:hypothetical protein